MHRQVVAKDILALTGVFDRALRGTSDQDLDLIAGKYDAQDEPFLAEVGTPPGAKAGALRHRAGDPPR